MNTVITKSLSNLTELQKLSWVFILCFASQCYAAPLLYQVEIQGQKNDFYDHQSAYDYVMSVYPDSSATGSFSGKENESIFYFSDYCFANDRGFNGYGSGFFGSKPRYCGFKSAQAVVEWIVPDSQERCLKNPNMNPEFFAASLASNFREDTKDYILELKVDTFAGCGTIQGKLRTQFDRVYAQGELAKMTVSPLCKYPYSYSAKDVIDGDLKTGCVAYCSSDRPELVDGVCQVSNGQTSAEQCTAGNPVSISDGTKVQLEPPVYQGAGAFPLSFQYQYNGLRSPEAKALQQQSISTAADKTGWVKYVQPAGYTGLANPPALTQLAVDKVNGVRLGGFKSWSHNYQGQLTVLDSTASTVSLQSTAFESRQFIKQADGSYRSRNLTSDTLSRVVDEQGSLVHWIYRSVDNQFEYYNAKGQLTRRVNKAGLSHYLEYDNNGQLALVRDDAGNQLQFSFDDKGKLLTVITPTEETISYGYDQYANLETVTKVLGTKTTERRYHYEDARHPYALTGITDENGVRYATWEYDEQGRAITSKHAGEVDKTTFAFESLQTTVTNPLGKQTVYHYQNTAGAKRLNKVEGVASTNCLAANQHYTYYPNGQIETKTDWKGIVTRFEYNDRHLESKRIEAAGTPEQRVITTTWYPEFNLPATVKVGNQVTTYEYHTNGLLKSQHVSKVLK